VQLPFFFSTTTPIDDVCAGALCAAKVLRGVTPVDAGGLLGCTLITDDVSQLRGLVVELICSFVFVYVVCAANIMFNFRIRVERGRFSTLDTGYMSPIG